MNGAEDFGADLGQRDAQMHRKNTFNLAESHHEMHDEPLLGSYQRRRGQLKTADDVVRTLGRVIRATLNGKLGPKRGAVAIQGLRVLLEAMEAADNGRKVRDLEELLRRQQAEQLQRRAS